MAARIAGLPVVLGCSLLVLVAAACSSGSSTVHKDGAVNVAVTTDILADFVRQVGGDRVNVTTIVPPGGDPHSYEPTPANAKQVAKADAAFTNHFLLEEHALIKMFDSNVRKGVPNISLAESSERYGAHLIPLVEDVGLDVVWLGLAVRGRGPNRAADIQIHATSVQGPGAMMVYVTSELGVPEVYFDSTDGLSDKDVIVLPPGAHTHVNWAFTAPGVYRLKLAATLAYGGETKNLASATFTFAVGVEPATAAPGRQVLDQGHADLAVDLDNPSMFVCTAPLSCAEQKGDVDSEAAVIEVPNRAVELVPNDKQFAFLGSPGTQIWQLPQAVLGKHVHGEIDPHLWEDVKNAKAYVQVIADTLISVDPEGAETYKHNSDAYLQELGDLDAYLGQQTAKIPLSRRNLVTTHDAFAYLADAYGMKIAGFVVPNPAQEPSAVQVTKLTETIRNLHVPAVFAEPNLAARASVLKRVAADQGVQVCVLYGDAFDPNVHTYVEMMRHNAEELVRCLGG